MNNLLIGVAAIIAAIVLIKFLKSCISKIISVSLILVAIYLIYLYFQN